MSNVTIKPETDQKPADDKRIDLLDNKLMGTLGLRVKADEVKGIKKRWTDLWRRGLDRDDLWGDGDFMDDVRQASLRGASPASSLMFNVLAGFIIIFLLWATFAQIDEVAHGQGQVVPSGNVQAVGSSEGGMVAQILVKQGDIVQPGQELVRLDDSLALAGVGEKENRRDFLQATITRLEAELDGKELAFDPELEKRSPAIVEEARTQFESRAAELASSIAVFKEQAEQRRQDLNDAQRRAGSMQEAYNLAKQELDLTTPYLSSGAISQVDLLRIRRDVVDAQKELTTARLAVPSAAAALREADKKLEEGTLQYKNRAREELAKSRDEFKRLGSAVGADIGRQERTVLKSPILAEVKQLLVNTVGQAVQPNTNIVELVPLDKTLLVEAKIKPQDIAFIRPGQEANVKITSYDSSIYGGLKGEVEGISPDSFLEEKTGQTYYKIQVRTDKNYLEHGGHQYPIKSGMVATADVLTGKKTIMNYLLKPLNKARQRALTER